MVQDVFEVSKAASGQLPVSLKRLDLARLLRQTLADMDQPIQESGLQLPHPAPRPLGAASRGTVTASTGCSRICWATP